MGNQTRPKANGKYWNRLGRQWAPGEGVLPDESSASAAHRSHLQMFKTGHCSGNLSDDRRQWHELYRQLLV